VDSIVCHACCVMMKSIHNSSCVGHSSDSRCVAQCGNVGVSGVEVTQGWVWTWVFLLEVPSRYMSVLDPGVVEWRLYVLSFLSPLYGDVVKRCCLTVVYRWIGWFDGTK
jgi:hypothetical protein